MNTDFSVEIEELFSPTGALSTHSGFEFRPQQGRMATAIARALDRAEHLIVEAPTGTGKTIAYLIPALLYAAEHNRKAIVSTHTRNLQEQILRKDVPLACSIIGREFDAVALKGRRNYLCRTRLNNTLAGPRPLFTDEGQSWLDEIRDWSARTQEGDVEELHRAPPQEVWSMVCSEPDVCTPARCGPGCFYQKARERARAARLVIMNHALFFQLLALRGTEDRFIYENDFVIFDEAQALESVAGSGFGKTLSRLQLLGSLHRLYNPKTKRGLFARRDKPIRDLSVVALRSTEEFFGALRKTALAARPDGVLGKVPQSIRIRTPNVIDNTIDGPLADLCAALHKREEGRATHLLEQEIGAARKRLSQARALIKDFLELGNPQCAYWIEEQGSSNVALCSSPPEVGGILGPVLFRDGSPAILTSATLSIDGQLGYFAGRIGAGDARTLVLDSPFDYRRQMRLTLTRDIPEPDSEEYAHVLPHWIMLCIDRTRGKALVLFTSAATMRSAAEIVRPRLQGRGITFLVQDADSPRHRLLEQFKHDIHSVLFGLDSFWMGVDVPGEALEHVVITRLPFLVPNHPLTEARMEVIAARGENPFLAYTLPEAVLKFRQGTGRLLRTREDRGIVTVLDSRILRKGYGRMFVGSIPQCPIEVMLPSGDVEPFLPEEV